MDLRIDEKGKYFTTRVAKDSLAALIRTNDQLIIGQIYVRPERRLKDEMNADTSRFLPVTNARVFHPMTDALLFETTFLLVAFQHIVMISPLDAMPPNEHTAAWYGENELEPREGVHE